MKNEYNSSNSSNSNIVAFTQLTMSSDNKDNVVKDTIPCLFYDVISKKFVGILSDRIELFNKKSIKLHQYIKITLPKQQIQAVTIETNYKYLMLLVVTRNKTKSIVILNLRNKEVIKIIHIENSSVLKGMMFLSQSNEEIGELEYTDFCLIFQSQIYFYSIDKDTNEISTKHLVTYSNSIKIKDSIYNNVYMIHCVIRSDSSIDFYNYVNEAFYDKSSHLSYRKLKIEQKEKNSNTNNYIHNMANQSVQLFLQVLHKELFFIVFGVDNSIISLYQTKRLNDLIKVMDINLPANLIKAGLLFVDDLILVVNMNNWEIIVIDINSLKKDNKIVTKFTYNNILSLDLKQIEIIKGSLLKYGQLFYSVSINYKAFYESVATKAKHKGIMILFEKKGTKEFIYKYVKDMIQNKQKGKYIVEIIHSLVMQISKSIKPPQELLLNNKDNEYSAVNVVTPLSFFLKRHKRLMKQIDLFYLFQSLQDCIGLEYDIVRYYKIFCSYSRSKGIKLQPNFTNLLLTIIKRIPFEMCTSLFKYFPENEELALFLLDMSTKIDNESLKKLSKQRAYDILLRLNNKEQLFELLLNEECFQEAMLLYIKYQFKISSGTIKNAIAIQIKSNRKMMLQFIQQ